MDKRQWNGSMFRIDLWWILWSYEFRLNTRKIALWASYKFGSRRFECLHLESRENLIKTFGFKEGKEREGEQSRVQRCRPTIGHLAGNFLLATRWWAVLPRAISQAGGGESWGCKNSIKYRTPNPFLLPPAISSSSVEARRRSNLLSSLQLWLIPWTHAFLMSPATHLIQHQPSLCAAGPNSPSSSSSGHCWTVWGRAIVVHDRMRPIPFFLLPGPLSCFCSHS